MTKIFYTSHYGSSKQYAEWIAERLSCSCQNSKEIKKQDLTECSTLVFGCGIYAGRINGIEWLRKNIPQLKNKNIIVFTVGLSDENDPAVQTARDGAFSAKEQHLIRFFHFRGAMNITQLSFGHRLVIKMLPKMLQNKEASLLSEAEKSLLSIADTPVDFLNKAAITELCEYVKSL